MTILCFEAHHRDGRVWAIRHRNRWIRAKRVKVSADHVTVYRGPEARQPRAYLAFLEPVKVCRVKGALVVKAA